MSIVDDLRYALRALRRAKGFTVVAVLTLAVGIAGATLMFALVHTIFVEPLPIGDPNRVIVAWKRTQTGTVLHYPFGAEAVTEVKEHAQSFERVAAFSYNGAMQFPAVENDVASYLPTSVVDGDFFRVLNVSPLLGRTLDPSDDVVGTEPVVVIDERLWERRYNRAPTVVGRRLQLLEGTYTIVGVVPAVDLPRRAEAWMTIRGAEAGTPSQKGFRRDHDLVARLKDGVTFAQAAAELENLSIAYEKRAGRNVVASVKPYVDELVGEARAPVWTLFSATLLVLLIACANVANLLLMRGEDRRVQLAMRAALGARRLRLAQLIGLEALVLCTLGAGVGLLLAKASLGVVIATAPAELPRLERLAIDWSIVLFGVTAAVVAAGAASAPSLLTLGVDAGVLNSAGTRSTRSAFRQSRRVFVVTQVALSITILAAAGVLTRTLLRLQSADMGFSADRLAFVELFLPHSKYSDPQARRPFFDALTARVRAIPGVEAVVPIAVRPYAGLSGWDMPRWVADGQGPEEAARNPGLDLQSVYPDHFETMAVPIREGRAINQFDREGSLRVAVISENAARQVWPGQSALGKRLKWGGFDSDGPWFTVVGVAATTRYRELSEPRASVYLPATQFVDGAEGLAIRSSTPLATLSGPLRDRVRDLDGSVFVIRSSGFSEFVAGPLARPRFLSALASTFGAIALLLAAVGLYGVMAAFVRQSSREIGVRVALGARAHHVRGLVFGEAARLAGFGVIIGVISALTTGRLLRGLLFDAPPLDPVVVGLAAVAMTLTIVIACYQPMRRALRIDPVALLRAD